MADEFKELLEAESEDFQIGFNSCLNTFFMNIYLPLTQSLINQLKLNYSYSDDIMLQHIEETYDSLQEYLQDLIVPTANDSAADVSEASVKYNFPNLSVDNFFERISEVQTGLLKINYKQLFENKVNTVVLKNLERSSNNGNNVNGQEASFNLISRSLVNSNFIIPEEMKSTTRHRRASKLMDPRENRKLEEIDKENIDTQRSLENLIEESFHNT